MRIATDDVDFDSTALTADRESDAIWIGHALNYACQVTWTGTPVGAFKLQVSLDKGDDFAPTEAQRGQGIVNWTDLPSSSQATSGVSSVVWNVEDAGYRWVRIVYTHTSGSGTVSASRFSSKGI